MRVHAIVRFSDGEIFRTHAYVYPNHFMFGGDHPGATHEIGGEMYLLLAGKWYRLNSVENRCYLTLSAVGSHLDSELERVGCKIA